MTSASLRTLLREAWSHRFSEWQRFALFLTRSAADADDLVDEAVVRTLQAHPRLKSEDEVHAYLVTAIRNTWSKWRRVRSRRHALLQELGSQPEECASDALEELIRAEEQGRVEKAVSGVIQKMKPKIRAAIGLYLSEDQEPTLEEIAANQRISVSTAHRRVREALRILAEELKEFDG